MKRFALFAILLPFLVAAKDKEPELPKPIGPKFRIAVWDVEPIASGSYAIGNGVMEVLVTMLVQTGQFQVLERDQLEAVIQEQELGGSGKITPATAAQAAKILGAQILLMGGITGYEKAEQGNVLGGIFGDVVGGIQTHKSSVTIDLRAVNTETAEILWANSRKESATKSRVGAAVDGFDIALGGWNDTPTGKAVRKSLGGLVLNLADSLVTGGWRGKVVTVKDGDIYLNGGENFGLKPGFRFTLYRPGESLIDPETGLELGTIDEEMGTVIVTKVEEKYALARAEGSLPATEIERGDVVVFILPPQD